MSTAAQVRAAWLDNIWTHATVQAYTTKIYDYDITSRSQKEAAKFRHNTSINFLTYITTRGHEMKELGSIGATSALVHFNFQVEIRYYLEADSDGEGFNAVIDRLGTIDGLVVSQLGKTWDSTVDFYRPQQEPPTINLIELDGRPVWLGVYRYFALKRATLS